MKKIVAVGIVCGVVVFVFFTSCAKKMEASGNRQKKGTDVADKNKTEGYFYHQTEQDRATDSTKIRKNVNN